MSSLKPSCEMSAAHAAAYARSFRQDPKHRLALNAVTKQSLFDVAVNREVVARTDHSFSHNLHNNPSTSQKRSGRCWAFAGLNLFRAAAIQQFNVDDFEFSQTYTMFWDKFEKSNYFLESILRTLDEPTNSRLIMFLMQDPIQDGGQWDMFVNLIKKYGVVPKTAMPESDSSSNSRVMNMLITSKLREFAAELRRAYQDGTEVDALRARKVEMMDVVYRMLCIHLGQPPEKFYWQWRDKDNKFTRVGELTPQQFFNEHIKFPLDDMVCLINCPTADKPFNQLYTVDYLGNVVEGEIIRYLNVPIDVFKKAAVDNLVAGQPVWFGCDVGKMLERKLGILDTATYDYTLVYDTEFGSDKAERVDYGQSLMTHAMVFTGVDLDENQQPRKWRVENSWGDEIGDKGYLVMNDAWFDEYMYEVVVDKKHVPAEVLALLMTEPVYLPPWDPMGALAAAGSQ